VLPSIVADLGGAAFYAWATLLYTIASIIGTVCGGRLMARLDLRRGYLVGVLVFLGGSVGGAMAPHMAVLLVARTLQGLGSGLLVAIAYSMVSELYIDVLRPRVLSAISGMWGVAALLGVGPSGSRYQCSCP
jgi:MFS family permease